MPDSSVPDSERRAAPAARLPEQAQVKMSVGHPPPMAGYHNDLGSR
jgi:hypothetical protein